MIELSNANYPFLIGAELQSRKKLVYIEASSERFRNAPLIDLFTHVVHI